MATSRPVSGYKFEVVCNKITKDGSTSTGFSRVSGLEVETEVVEYREGTGGLNKLRLRGLETYPVVVLEKGVTGSNALIDWYEEVRTARDPTDMMENVLITLHDREGGELGSVTTFKLTNAWPSKLNYEDLDASSSDVLIHRLELTHEGLEIDGKKKTP